MNYYLATATQSRDRSFGRERLDSSFLVLLDISNITEGSPELVVGGSAANMEYLNFSAAHHPPYIALRHSDQFNYLTKSGAVFSTKSGVSGLGLQPVWHYDQSTGKYWRDGVYRTE